MIVVQPLEGTEIYVFTATVDSIYIERKTALNSCVRPLNAGQTHVSQSPLFVKESQDPAQVDVLVSEVTAYYQNLQS